RCVGADAERERQDDDERPSLALQQHADPVSQISKHGPLHRRGVRSGSDPTATHHSSTSATIQAAMRTLRRRKSIVLLGPAVLVGPALTPAAATALPSAVLTALWIVAPPLPVADVHETAPRGVQPLSLVSLPLFRAPPAPIAVA